MSSSGIVEAEDIFEKTLHNGVVVGVTLSRKGFDHIQIIQVFSELFRCILRISVGVKNYSVRLASVCDCKIYGIRCKLRIDFVRLFDRLRRGLTFLLMSVIFAAYRYP